MAKYFYDKVIIPYTLQPGLDDEGGRTEGKRENKGQIECNIQPLIDKLLIEAYGITNDRSLKITCATDTIVEKKWKFEYLGNTYRIEEVLRYDSHLVLLCQ